MKKDRIDVSDKTAISMPMRNLIGIVTAVSVGVWAFFGIQETLNKHSTTLELMERDLEMNTEFRIKWPRGMLGSLPADSEQYMMLEDLYKTTDRINKQIESMMHNKVNIEFLTKQMNKVLGGIEKLKDKQRSFSNGNGTH